MITQTVLLSVTRVVQIVFSSVVGILIARYLGDEARGFYSLGTTIFVLSTAAGLVGAEIRVRVQAFQFSDLTSFFQYYKKLFFIGWGIAVLVMAALSAMQWFSLPFWVWGILVLGLGVVLWQDMLYALYHIQGKPLRPILVASLVSYSCVLLCLVLLLVLDLLTVEIALGLYVLQILVSVGCYIIQKVPLVQKDEVRSVVSVWPPYVNSLANVLSKRIDVLLLAPIALLAGVGHFAVAMSVFDISLIPAVVMGQTLLNKNNDMQHKLFIYSIYAVCCIGFLVLMAPYLVVLVFGTHFQISADLMPYLAALVLPSLGWTYTQGMLWRSFQNFQSVIPVLCVVLGKAALIPYFYKEFELEGVILSAVVVYTIGSLISFVFYKYLPNKPCKA